MNLTDVRGKVYEAIQKSGADISLEREMKESAIMYTYGSVEEFKEIISELEEHYKIELSYDVGEMKLAEFVKTVEGAVLKLAADVR